MHSFSGSKGGAYGSQQRLVGQGRGLVSEGKGNASATGSKMTAGKDGKGHDLPGDFAYYIVMDFEATCWEGGQSTSDQEIIEFPAVLVNAATLDPITEFREFVRPTECPRLSAYCSQLTSIQQQDVDKAAPLQQVLWRFGAWLDGYGLQTNPSVALPITCGNWDLQSMLPTEVRRRGLDFHPTLGWWCNIKDVFSHFMGRDRPPGMGGMLKALRLPLIGHHHLGIDDCRNIARILQELVRRHGATISASGGRRPVPSAAMPSSVGTATRNEDAAVATATTERKSNLTVAQKEMLKLQKTLREIANLKQRRDGSSPLERNQVSKIAREEELKARLGELLSLESTAEAADDEGDHGTAILSKASVADAAAPGPAAVDTSGTDLVLTASERVPVERRVRPRGGCSGFRRMYDADH